MPPLGPIKRRDFIAARRRSGFSGPFYGGKHQFMIKGALVLTIPNPHAKEMSRRLLLVLLREAAITRQIWEQI